MESTLLSESSYYTYVQVQSVSFGPVQNIRTNGKRHAIQLQCKGSQMETHIGFSHQFSVVRSSGVIQCSGVVRRSKKLDCDWMAHYFILYFKLDFIFKIVNHSISIQQFQSLSAPNSFPSNWGTLYKVAN